MLRWKMTKGSDPYFGSDDHCVVVIFTTCYVEVVIIVLLQKKLKCNFYNESHTKYWGNIFYGKQIP